MTYSNLGVDVRKEFLSQANEINLIAHQVIGEFPALEDYVAAPIPTLENNIWSSNVGLQDAIHKRLTAVGGDKGWAFSSQNNWKRTTVGLIVETLVGIARAHFGITIVRKGTQELKKGSTILFTYSDYDNFILGRRETSVFWGRLPLWLKHDGAVSWVGVGAHRPKEKKTVPRKSQLLGKLRFCLRILATFPARVRLWSRLKQELGNSSLFGCLQNEIKRALFGFPAFQAAYLQLEFARLLDDFQPSKVLVPHENQLWERVLAIECRARDINFGGVIHTTPRFWDLRFFLIEGFANMQPTQYVDNGPASRAFLELGRIPSERIIAGTALRFEHLAQPRHQEMESGNSTSPRKALVVTGSNIKSAANLVVMARQMSSLKHHEISYRPHPATRGSLQKLLSSSNVEVREVADFALTYDIVITESMSSIALELAASGAKIAVYVPEGCLNFSPLLICPEFRAYFKDNDDLNVILKSDNVAIEASSIIATVNSGSRWKQILEDLESGQPE